MGPPEKRRRRRWATIALAVALGLTVAAGAFVRWPIWCSSQLVKVRLELHGVHGRTLALDGLSIHYLEGGNGRPVVFVHGLGSRALDWDAVLRAAVHAGYRVYAMDLPGFGESSKPKGASYSVSEQAKFIGGFLDALHLDRLALVGQSMGGWIAASVALDAPKRISQLVLVDSAGLDFQPAFDTALFAPSTPAQVDQLMAILVPQPTPLPSFLKEAVVRWVAQDGWVVRRAMASMVAKQDVLDERFSALHMPLLLVWGEQDMVTPLALGQKMHGLAPQSVLEVLSGCGHFPEGSCQSRLVSGIVTFLSESGPAPGSTVVVPAS
jgi:pimeloyl-ACP methyl ester carboxylesterase